MLSTRKHESERTLQASPEAQAQQQRFREMAWKLEFLQQQVNAAKQQQRGLKPQPSHEADDTDNEPQPKV